MPEEGGTQGEGGAQEGGAVERKGRMQWTVKEAVTEEGDGDQARVWADEEGETKEEEGGWWWVLALWHALGNLQ
jgi:hypothetical protein